MNIKIIFSIGCITFLLMLVIKIPIKKITRLISNHIEADKRKSYIIFKRLNFIIIILTVLIAIIGYKLVFPFIGEEHYNFSGSLEAGAIAIVLYAIYEQLK